MPEVTFPYGKAKLCCKLSDEELAGVLTSALHGHSPRMPEETLVKQALENPVGSERLCEMAKGKKNIVVIASDHTRPVPSRIIMPEILREIRSTNPTAQITILVATGCHRTTTRQELIEKFGADIVDRERIYVHDCDDREKLVNIGKLPSGGDCEISAIACRADLLVAEGFIEPHFFAGFSGGRKSVLPGVSGRSTVLANHCAEFIDSPYAKTGILENNPIHEDMLWAAKQAKLRFIVNVVLNAEKEIIFAAAGDSEAAHRAGTDFLTSLCGVDAVEADVAITTNGGYPLDQNVYQAVKGMTAGEATVKKDGVIIMLAASNDGIGGDSFYHQLVDEPDIQKTYAAFLARGRNETVPDQWQTQIMIRVLSHARVIYISELPDETIEKMHMIPAHSIESALQKAKEILKKEKVKIVAIPDGVSVIVRQ